MADQDMNQTDDVKAADQPADDQQAADQPVTDTAGEPKTGGTDQYGRQLYKVNCSSCGAETEVPFKPAGNRPVYCRDCYMKQRNDRRGGDRGGRQY